MDVLLNNSEVKKKEKWTKNIFLNPAKIGGQRYFKEN